MDTTATTTATGSRKKNACEIGGCIYSALYILNRPESWTEVKTCRKCAPELINVYDWKFVRRMTRED